MHLLAAAGAADFPTTAIGRVVWAMVCLGTALRARWLLRQPEANRRALAGYIVFSLTFVVALGVVAFQSGVRTRTTMAVGVAVVVGMVIACFLALEGIVEARRKQGRTKGSGYAVVAALCSGGFVAVAAAAVIGQVDPVSSAAIDTQAAGKGIENKDLNFRLRQPPAPWADWDAKRVNKDATLAFLRRSPDAYFILIAEKSDGGITPDAMIDMWQANVRSTMTDVTFGDRKPLVSNGLTGVQAHAHGKNTVDISFINWATTSNGYVYQLVTWTDGGNEDFLREEAAGMIARFSVLDTSRVHVSGKAVQPYRSDFGYSVDLGKPWLDYPFDESKNPTQEYGAKCGTNTLTISPLPLLGENPDLEDIATACMVRVGMDESAGKTYARKSIMSGGLPGIEAVRELAPGGRRQRMRVFKGVGTAFLINEMEKPDSPPSEGCTAPADKIVFSADTRPPVTDPVRRDGLSLFFNELGLLYYRVGKFREATTEFRQAHTLNPSDVQLLLNVSDGLARQGHRDEAATLLEHELSKYPGDGRVKARWAGLLIDNHRTQDGLDTYAELFKTGYDNEEDFLSYVRVLVARDKTDRAVEEMDAFLKRKDSEQVALEEATVLQRAKQVDKAVALLEARQKNAFSETAASSLTEIYLGAERYAEAASTADALVSRGYASADVWWLAARAQYGLKWYAKSKASAEAALKLKPGDADLKEFLEHVSGVLGEGSNTSIKDPIEAVKIPASLMADIAPSNDDLNDRSAFYLHRWEAMRYEKDKEFRRTGYSLIKVIDAAGVTKFSTIELGFDPLFEAIYVNTLEVMDDKGAVVAKGNPSDYYLSDDADQDTATQRRTAYLPVPGLKPGYTIRLIVTTRDLAPPSRFTHTTHIFTAYRPVVRDTLFLSGDVSLVHAVTAGGVTEKKLPEGIAWTVDHATPFVSEPLAVPAMENYPSLWLTEAGANWDHEAANYLKSMADWLKPDPAVVTVAKKEAGASTTPEEKTLALSRYVQKELTYKAIEFGRGATIPRAVPDILGHGFGDCKDHALLLQQLLNASGVESHLALISTGSPVKKEAPSFDQFNHMIVFIPEGRRFIDATDKNTDPSAPVPSGLAGADAFVLDPKHPRFEHIPEYPAGSSELSVSRDVHIDGTDLKVHDSVTFSGLEANSWRDYLQDIESTERTKSIQDRLSEDYPDIKVQKVEIHKLDQADKPLQIKVTYTVRNALHELDGHLVGRIPAPWERGPVVPPDLESRKSPFEYRQPLHVASVVELNVPHGWTSEPFKSANGTTAWPFGDWKIDVDGSGDLRRETFDFQRKTGRHPAKDYAGMRQGADVAVRALEQEVSLKRPTETR